MANQTRYYVTRDDFTSLLGKAQDVGCVALPQIIDDADSTPDPQSPLDFFLSSDHDEGYFYLMPSNFSLVEAFYKKMRLVPNQAKLLAHTSPVVEISPHLVNNDSICEGRLYFCQEKDDPRYDKAFRMYQTLKRFIAKNWQKAPGGVFYGEGVADMICRGVLKLSDIN